MLAAHYLSGISGLLGAGFSFALLTWIASRADKQAKVCDGKDSGDTAPRSAS